MTDRERFVNIWRTEVKREGADRLLEWLCSPSCDFFTAPASTRFHGSVRGGLCAHSLNVYDCLCDYMTHSDMGKSLRDRSGEAYTRESLAITALLHDLCKVNFYRETTRNVKKNGVWETVPYYSIEDDLPYGHGEKSVFLIERKMRLKLEEAMAIRWHMGGFDEGGGYTMSDAYNKYPLAVKLHLSDLESTYLREKGTSDVNRK